MSGLDSDCEQCKVWKEHIFRAREARTNYKLEQQSEDSCVRSVDLQKVIMLPRIQGCKTVVFTRRLVVFHETFAVVGSQNVKSGKPKRKNLSVIWHEACAGRKAEEIASTFRAAIDRERDMKHLTYWMDNCSSQNKNWCLMTMLVNAVNDPTVAVEDITLKYFEPGHTFMSADSVHHGVEKAMPGKCIDVILGNPSCFVCLLTSVQFHCYIDFTLLKVTTIMAEASVGVPQRRPSVLGCD